MIKNASELRMGWAAPETASIIILSSFRAIADLTPISKTKLWSMSRLNCSHQWNVWLEKRRADGMSENRASAESDAGRICTVPRGQYASVQHAEQTFV